MKKSLRISIALPVFAFFLLSLSTAQNGPSPNGLCNHAEAVAKNDPVVSALLDNWNTGCWRLNETICKPLGEVLVLCAEHPCPAPLNLVELTYPIRSFLCAVQVPPPGYIKVHVLVGGGSNSATVVESPSF